MQHKIYPVGIKYDQSIEKLNGQHVKISNAEAKDSANRKTYFIIIESLSVERPQKRVWHGIKK
jgi:hypothetical protein